MQRRMSHRTHVISRHAGNIRVADRDLVGKRKHITKQGVCIWHTVMFGTELSSRQSQGCGKLSPQIYDFCPNR